MSRLLLVALWSIAALALTAALPSRTVACDLCRRLGTTAYHVAAIGGDNSNDAILPPAGMADEPGGLVAQPAFATVGAQWPQPEGPGTPITLTYSYQNLLDGGLKMPNGQPLPTLLIRRSIETAFRLWASVVPVHFVEVADDGLEYFQNSRQHGQLRFRHIYINGPDIPGQPPTTKAQAYFPYGVDPYAGDVEFDNSDRWQEAGTLPIPDVLGAATHEIGHTLGLAHTGVQQANMYWIFRRTKGLDDGWLHPDDIAGIRSIYGAGTGSVTPLFAPEPATSMMLLFALLLFSAASRAVLGPGRSLPQRLHCSQAQRITPPPASRPRG